MNPAIDIRPEHAAMVRDILSRSTPPGTRIWAFGSRVKGTAKPVSDLDLAIDAGHALSLTERALLAEQFEESALPWKVDIVDLHSVSDGFRHLIERDRRLFFERR